MLRLFTGVIIWLIVVAVGYTGVDVIVGGTFSVSESDPSGTVEVACFLATAAISFNISFWFSANILVKSDKIPFLTEDFISSKFSVWTSDDLLVAATEFSFRTIPLRGVSCSNETTIFYSGFWLSF